MYLIEATLLKIGGNMKMLIFIKLKHHSSNFNVAWTSGYQDVELQRPTFEIVDQGKYFVKDDTKRKTSDGL